MIKEMKLFPIAVLLILAIRGASQNPTEQLEQVSKEKPETCTVQGMVVSASTGEPLRGTRVVLIDRSQDEHPESLTDSNGHFVITGVRAGTYHFRADKMGYVEQAYHSDPSGGRADLLVLEAGQKLDRVLFRLNRAGVIVGRITDEAEEPLVGVLVVGLVSQDGMLSDERPAIGGLTPIQYAFTNDLGEYRIYNLPPGSYYVAASDTRVHLPLLGGEWPSRGLELGRGGEFRAVSGDHPPLYYPGVTRPSEAEKVKVNAGQERRIDLSLRLVKMVTVSGRVVDAAGKPAPDYDVHLRLKAKSVDTRDVLEAMTDAQGNFEVKKVLPGSYTISAEVHGFVLPDDSQTQYWTEQQIEVAGDNITGLHLQLSADLELSGKVSTSGGEKVDLSRLLALEYDTNTAQGSGSAYPNKDGTFAIRHLRHTTLRRRYWLPDGWYVRSATFGDQNVLEDGLQLAGGDAGHTLEITVSPEVGQVDGVVMRGPDSVPGAKVKLLPDPEHPFRDVWPATTWTDAHGHFVLKNVVPGSYRAVAFDVEADPADNDEGSQASINVVVGRGESKTVQIKLTQTHE